MIIATFALVMLVALGAGVWSRRGATTDIGDFLVGSRSFGGLLVFVLAVGEIYSIGTLIGFPGGVYAKGASYGVWFVGYILVAYPIGYWLAPYMWRAGALYGAMTFPDAAGRHFRSPVLERVLAVSAVLFLIPWGQLQLTGLQVAMSALGIDLNPTAAVFAGAAPALVFLLLSGVRAPAFVSFVKDTCLLLAALLIGLAAVGRSGGLTQLFASAKAAVLIFGWRLRASALTAGLVVGEVLVLWLYVDAGGAASLWLADKGINIGLVALAVNTLIVVASRLLWPAVNPVRGLRTYTRLEVAAAASSDHSRAVTALAGPTADVRAKGDPPG